MQSKNSQIQGQTPDTPDANEAFPSTVLVVDDSRLQRKIVSSSLTKWGFRVLEADSGESAVEICRKELPDFVLSDWMMPGISGLEFCQRFRELTGERYGYFILLTSKSEKDEVARGLEAGADDFLTKPVSAHELRARIMAGERIVKMQRELTEKNRLISDTLVELQRVYDSLDSDLLEAKKLQQSLLRERFRSLPEGDLSLMLRPCGHVGGDLVGFFPAGTDHLGLYAIDVSGHGVSSALMTARLAGYLSATAPDQNVALERQDDGTYRPRRPDQVVETINNLVLGEMETEHYFTLLLAHVELSTGKVVLCQAGHPHPVIQRSSGVIEHCGTGGFPVGLVEGVSFDCMELKLDPGDRLLMLSDGVTECPGADGQMLEEDGLAELMTDLEGVRGPAFFEALLWKLGEFAASLPFPDDVSGVLFEFSGQDQPK